MSKEDRKALKLAERAAVRLYNRTLNHYGVSNFDIPTLNLLYPFRRRIISRVAIRRYGKASPEVKTHLDPFFHAFLCLAASEKD